MDIILSVRPRLIEQVLRGNKLFELRRVLPKYLKKGDKVFMYAVGTGMVKGYFCVERIFRKMPTNQLLVMTRGKSSVNDSEFWKYFENREDSEYVLELGSAIEIGESQRINPPIPISDFGIKYPPQNFRYLRS